MSNLSCFYTVRKGIRFDLHAGLKELNARTCVRLSFMMYRCI